MQTNRMKSLMQKAIISLAHAEESLAKQPVLRSGRVVHNFTLAVDCAQGDAQAIRILQAARTELELAVQTIDEYEAVFSESYRAPFLVASGA